MIKRAITLAYAALIILTPCYAASTAHAAVYDLDKTQSTLTFSAVQSGEAFEGHFTDWDAAITFDPAALDASHITITIQTASAQTGDKMIDGALPQADWFASKAYPQATFTSTDIQALEQDHLYRVTGTLTIRDQAAPLTFDAEITDLDTDTSHAASTFKLDRLTYAIGQDTDPSAQWVDQDITVTFDLTASKAAQKTKAGE